MVQNTTYTEHRIYKFWRLFVLVKLYACMHLKIKGGEGDVREGDVRRTWYEGKVMWGKGDMREGDVKEGDVRGM